MIVYSQLSDVELISLIKQEDRLAFAEIYKRYWKKLFTVAANKAGDLEEGREIVQNVFISLWNRRQELEIKGALSNYLAVSVKYRVINLLDKQNNHQNTLIIFILRKSIILPSNGWNLPN